MIHILKNREPRSFTTYRLTQDASYANIPSTVKNDLKKSLLKEQGELCAYCMSRISLEKMKIEHFFPQSKFQSKALEYSNLLAVCRGYEGQCLQDQTCDTKKSNQIITIDPLNLAHVNNITYSRDGTINSNSYQDDLDKILNLNLFKLKNNRKNALSSFQKELCKQKDNKTISKEIFLKLLKGYEEREIKQEYDGIIINYLKKKLELI